MNGGLITPNAFLKTELGRLIADAPESVRQWATTLPRPTSPKTLARWLLGIEQVMNSTQVSSEMGSTIILFTFSKD